MRIAHVATVDITLKALLLPQVRYLLERGHEVEMVASAGPHTPALRQAGFVVHNIFISRRIEPWHDLRSTMELARLFRRRRYDLVHTHTSKAGFVGRLAARLAGTPIVAHTAHGFFFHENMPPLQRRLFEGLERLAAGWTDLLFLQSREDYEYVLASGMVPPARARFLGNGIDLDTFDITRWDRPWERQFLRQTFFGDGDYIVALMVAFMIERKGHIYLLKALELLGAEAGALRLLLVGDGPLEDSLRKFVRDAGLESRVTFAGYREDIPRLLAGADIYVLASLSEGMPRSILEAMAMELPVIASDIRGCRELVWHGETGLLVPPADAGALAEALCRLADDAKLRQSMGRAGRRRVLQEFDERLVFQRLEQGYQDICREKGLLP
ncbi:MAG: glycosyltransferase family 4 protein [Anaerolineae bacterium]